MNNQRNTERNLKKHENYLTDEKSLLMELNLALDDFFVCERFVTDDGITVKLENGQSFLISIKEIS